MRVQEVTTFEDILLALQNMLEGKNFFTIWRRICPEDGNVIEKLYQMEFKHARTSILERSISGKLITMLFTMDVNTMKYDDKLPRVYKDVISKLRIIENGGNFSEVYMIMGALGRINKISMLVDFLRNLKDQIADIVSKENYGWLEEIILLWVDKGEIKLLFIILSNSDKILLGIAFHLVLLSSSFPITFIKRQGIKSMIKKISRGRTPSLPGFMTLRDVRETRNIITEVYRCFCESIKEKQNMYVESNNLDKRLKEGITKDLFNVINDKVRLFMNKIKEPNLIIILREPKGKIGVIKIKQYDMRNGNKLIMYKLNTKYGEVIDYIDSMKHIISMFKKV